MKACLFDIDGTLVMTGGAGVRAFEQTFAEDFGVLQISQSVPFAGRSDRAIAQDLFEKHGLEASEGNWKRFCEGYLARLDSWLKQCEGIVLPGVVALIDALEARGDVLIGLLTGNIHQAAKLKLSHYDLWNRFDFGGFGDLHTDRNDIAATAVREAETRHQGAISSDRLVVVIGDTPNDIRCARSVGARAVATPTGHTPAEVLQNESPDLLVSSLKESQTLMEWFAS